VLSKGLPGLQSEVRFNFLTIACRRAATRMADCKLRWSSVADCSKVHLLTAASPRARVSDCAQTAPGCSARQKAHVSMSHLCASARAGSDRRASSLQHAGHGAYPPRSVSCPCECCSALPSRWDLSETRRVLVVNLVHFWCRVRWVRLRATDRWTLTLHDGSDGQRHAGQ
jgi:hypothetical protein